jgi:hypothetical protein
MNKNTLRPIGETLVRYTAEEMPTGAIEEIHAQTVKDVNEGDLKIVDALKITNLLLTIALQKLQAIS